MKIPPYRMKLHIGNDRRNLRLWLPLFLLWPILLVIALIMLPLILLAAIMLWFTGWGRMVLGIIPAVFSCLCGLRGLEVDVENNEERFLVSMK